MFKMYVKEIVLPSSDNGSEWDPPEDIGSNDLGGQLGFATGAYVRPFTIPAFQSVTKLVFELD